MFVLLHTRDFALVRVGQRGIIINIKIIFKIRMTYFQLTCEHKIKEPVCLARNTQKSALVHHLQYHLAGGESRVRLHGESTSVLPEKVKDKA